MKLRIATRRSALALAQTRATARLLADRNPGLEIEEVPIVTEGDRIQDRPLAAIGGKGLFVKELEAALLDGRADLAVHSMKDLPAELAQGLDLVCVPERESPWDLLVARDEATLEKLPRGARVGTSSLRRALQLKAARADLVIETLRGNVDTRLRKLRQGQFDAIVLAEAGLHRLGIDVRGERLDAVLVPAIGQGALALEARADDGRVRAWTAPLEHAPTRTVTRAERAVLRALGGSCVVPIGANAALRERSMTVRGFYATEDGSREAYAMVEGSADRPEDLGRELAETLRERIAATG